ncbi:Retrovirus-related Pol polyprotein from transposon RE2 [Vitis vinifera]|uniref:Retrovirus-related Pol polyprotein from transposon RE2 n=1 Tax=Vitis vinifera TaxID=29760 RepID=A0A438E1C1_VITVI|nr:Retrovirus-related Pol polyprotein from transposon RE2 [Vitis vinifera]
MATKNPIFTSVISGSPTITSEKLIGSDYDAYLRYQTATSASVASVASIAQTGNVSVCFTQSPSLGPWILDSGASDDISGNKQLFSSIITISALPTVTLANGSQTMAKGPEYGEDDWHRARLGHPNLSKFQKMVPRFSTLSSLACESCQLGKHTRVSFPKHLNNRDKLSAKATKCIFLGYSRLQKGYRCYSLDTHRYFLSADVTFFEDSPFFSSSESLPISEVLLLPYISPPSDVLSRPLQVYHRRHRAVVPPLSSAEVPDDSPLVPPISPTPALSSTDHLPIALWKGNRSTPLVRHFLILGGDRQWLMKWLLCTPMAHWILFLYLLVDRLKAHLVAKGYTQIYGCDYGDTFSPVAKIASVRLFLSMAAMCHWSFYQLDIKNVFLYGELLEEVYMEQPPGFVAQRESGLVCKLRHSLYSLKQSPRAWFGRFSSIVQEFGMLRSEADHSVFYHHNSSSQCIYLVVYVDDIVITGSDQEGLVMSQRKYALDILEETGTPGQGMLYEDRGHTQIVGYTDVDWAGSPSDRCSTSGYCVFIGGNLISWKSKKQNVVAKSSAEAEYRVMALATCELIWLRQLLPELRFGKDEQIKLVCDNQAALHIASNPVFHERTKHIEVDCHFTREKIASGCVAISFVNSNDQLADIFTKSLRGPRIKYICNKLGAYNIYAPA